MTTHIKLNKKFSQKPQRDKNQIDIENNNCPDCRKRGFKTCIGHAKGGGSDNKKTSQAAPKKKTSLPEKLQILTATHSEVTAINDTIEQWHNALKPHAGILTFTSGLLMIECDILRGILSFTENKDLSHSDENYFKQYLQTLQIEFNAFIEKLSNERGIDTSRFSAVYNGNNLRISINQPLLLAQFIEQLVKKNYLPAPTPQLQNKSKHENILSPLDISKRPKFKGRKLSK